MRYGEEKALGKPQVDRGKIGCGFSTGAIERSKTYAMTSGFASADTAHGAKVPEKAVSHFVASEAKPQLAFLEEAKNGRMGDEFSEPIVRSASFRGCEVTPFQPSCGQICVGVRKRALKRLRIVCPVRSPIFTLR